MHQMCMETNNIIHDFKVVTFIVTVAVFMKGYTKFCEMHDSVNLTHLVQLGHIACTYVTSNVICVLGITVSCAKMA